MVDDDDKFLSFVELILVNATCCVHCFGELPPSQPLYAATCLHCGRTTVAVLAKDLLWRFPSRIGSGGNRVRG
jgi:ferredoxin-like protein FixX